MQWKTFEQEMPQPGRSILVAWIGEECEDSVGRYWGYVEVFAFGKEPFGVKLYRGMVEHEADRALAEEIRKAGRWIYLSNAFVNAFPTVPCPVLIEGSIDATNPRFDP